MIQRTLGKRGPRLGAVDTTVALKDRVWVMASRDSLTPATVSEIDPVIGGLVLTGKKALRAAREIREQWPDLPLLVAPTGAQEREATADRPFVHNGNDEEGLFDVSVEAALQAQRSAGADLVVTPSGQVEAQDTPALKALIEQSNLLTAPDVLTQVVLPTIWLSDSESARSLCAILRRSEHPILLGLAHSSGSPLDSKKAMAGYQRVAQEVENVVAWGADLSGLGFWAQGGLGAVVGLRPSGRRFSQIGRHPQAQNPGEASPHVLLPELLRYSRVDYMRRELFASAKPLVCESSCCRGREVDRFDASDESVAAAHLHNTNRLYEMVNRLASVAHTARPLWWNSRAVDALAAHLELSVRVGREVKAPKDVQHWAGAISV